MVKGFFYFPIFCDKKNHVGVYQKTLAQLKTFNEIEDFEIEFAHLHSNGLMFNSTQLHKPFGGILPNLLLNVYRIITVYYPLLYKKVDWKQYQFIFLRLFYVSPFLIYFLKKIKKKYPHIIIYLEIATYPYITEFKGFPKNILAWIDQHFSSKLKKYITRIITYTAYTEIYHIPAIQISNGITIPSVMNPKVLHTPPLQILCLATVIQYWHGFDRVLYGLKKYMETTNEPYSIKINIVGTGIEKLKLETFVKENNLASIVTFYDLPTEKVYNEIIQKTHLGIGTLGMHRKNVFSDSSLKHRTYCTCGIPFILSMPDMSFPPNAIYWKYVEQNDTALRIEDLISFCHQLVKTNPSYQMELMNYAKLHLSWQATLKPVIESIHIDLKMDVE